MAHFAEVDENNIVTKVIVAEQNFIDSGAVGDSSNWIQTSYNTRGGVHYSPDNGEADNGIALRKNYAGVGFTYDGDRGAFYSEPPAIPLLPAPPPVEVIVSKTELLPLPAASGDPLPEPPPPTVTVYPSVETT